VLLRYTIKPVERILQNRHELSLNAYTVFSNYIFEINQLDNEEISGSLGKVISAYGAGVQYNLFFSRNLSVFGGINTQYLSSRIDFKEPEFAQNSYRFSSMAFSLGAGLAIHL